MIERLRWLGMARREHRTIEIDAASPVGRRPRSVPPPDLQRTQWSGRRSRRGRPRAPSLRGSFLVFMILATMIAAVGIVTDSIILIIGAMVVGPEFGPLAGLCVALVQRRPELARRSFAALAVGFPVAIASPTAVVLAGRAACLPGRRGPHRETLFISHPNRYSVIVALLAGVAGMISLTTAKAGALIGVLISVTTIPAAGNIGGRGCLRRLERVRRSAPPARRQPGRDRRRGARDARGAAAPLHPPRRAL